MGLCNAGPCEPLKFTMGDGTAMEGLEKVLEELPMDYRVRATLQVKRAPYTNESSGARHG